MYLLFFHPVVRVCAALLWPLRGRNSCCLWFWQLVLVVSLQAATSNLPSSPNHLSNRSVLHDGRKHRPLSRSFHNPKLFANKHVVQICRSSHRQRGSLAHSEKSLVRGRFSKFSRSTKYAKTKKKEVRKRRASIYRSSPSDAVDYFQVSHVIMGIVVIEFVISKSRRLGAISKTVS